MVSERPIVGISLDSQVDCDKYKYSGYPWYALRKDYSNCVSMKGGMPLMLTHELELIDEYLNMIDALILTGGDADIHPKFYGQEITHEAVKVNVERSYFEIELAKKALSLNMPILGICNGMQVLNVVFGGTLIQHIPATHPSNINHEQPHPKSEPTHQIIIEENTMLYKLANQSSDLMVNTTHHQALDQVGEGLLVSARAPDNIIEAVESTKHDFVVGVEWHPEYLKTPPLDDNLFVHLLEQAIKYRAQK